MSFYRDRHVRNFCFFLIFFVLLLLLLGLALSASQAEAAKTMFLSHDRAVVTSLLEQGVPEDVIATAITSTEDRKTGADFLTTIGKAEHTAVQFCPFILRFQQIVGYSMLAAGSFLSMLLLGGTFFFLRKRECLYQQAENTLSKFLDGDYSCHLPQMSEGRIYQIFASIEQLATMLQAKNETEHKAKEFLKNTISDISHQLKTPLAALIMYQEIIDNEPDNLRIVKEYTGKMGVALRRIEQLIQSMLKITRLDAGNIIFEKNYCQISELILQSINELTTRAKNEEKKIVIDGPPDEKIICDIGWTGEAIENIVKNALDHTDTGGIIHISWERSPVMIRISITDNGNGIAPEDIHHIFKRFYRSKNSLDRQGVGLGLSLAKSIVEGQGGNISVQSNINEGTTFRLSFLTEM